MTTITNDNLVNIMNEIQLHDKELYDDLANAIAEAKFIVPLASPLDVKTDGSDAWLEEGATIAFITLNNDKYTGVIAAFTDMENYSKANLSGKDTLVLSYDDVKSLLSNEKYSAVSINPFTHNFIFNEAQWKSITSHSYVIEEETDVMLGIPSKWPSELVEDLQVLLKRLGCVDSAHLLWMVRGSEASYLLVVDTDNRNLVFPQIGQLANQHLEKGEFLDIVDMSDTFGKNAVKNGKLIFEKKKTGLFKGLFGKK